MTNSVSHFLTLCVPTPSHSVPSSEQQNASVSGCREAQGPQSQLATEANSGGQRLLPLLPLLPGPYLSQRVPICCRDKYT